MANDAFPNIPDGVDGSPMRLAIDETSLCAGESPISLWQPPRYAALARRLSPFLLVETRTRGARGTLLCDMCDM